MTTCLTAVPIPLRTHPSASEARRLLRLALTIGMFGFPITAHANWPERPVRIIVTFPAGSANDSAARIFADALSKKWGKPVVV